MILSFKTKINDKPTLFIEKIWEGLFRHNFFGDSDDEFNNYLDQHITQFGKSWDELDENNRLEYPKIHTIRKDEKNRWKVGTMIDFFINTRTKDMFRFAPRIQVVSTQEIKIKYTKSSIDAHPLVYMEVDNKCLDTYNLFTQSSAFKLIEELALNDGFESVDDFLQYFNEDFAGKIIHWTDFKY